MDDTANEDPFDTSIRYMQEQRKKAADIDLPSQIALQNLEWHIKNPIKLQPLTSSDFEFEFEEDNEYIASLKSPPSYRTD
jgi:hypothetical protein